MKGINLKKVYNYLSDNRLFLTYVLLCSLIGLTLRIVTVGGASGRAGCAYILRCPQSGCEKGKSGCP